MTSFQSRAAADAAALISRIDAEIQSFAKTLASQVEERKGGDEALEKKLQDSEARNDELRALLVKTRMDLDAARMDLAEERQHAATLRAEAAQLTGEYDRTLDEMRRAHAVALAEQSAACALPLDELLSIFGAMKKAETGPELLDALLAGLAREFSRVALFHVNGPRLIAAKRLGFTGTDTSKPITLPADSILARAVSTGRLESVMLHPHGESGGGLPFGGTPACALAIPVLSEGTTTGVVYADDSDHVEFATGAPQVRMRFAELLQEYASLVLLRISVARKGTDDLRAFAASLVAELEYTYTVEAEAGRNRLECRQRLKDALEKARRRYAERAAGQAEAADLFDEQLAATTGARKESAFSSDIAVVLGPSRQRGRNILAMFR